MALTASEVQRVRVELGYHALTVSAEPYISYISIFDQIITPYLNAGATTTSATAVAAATEPTLRALTLTSAMGFAAFARVVVDVDAFQETATVRTVSGSTITLFLSKAHSGTYPVTVEGGESIIRELLARIAEVKTKMAKDYGAGTLKKVDEIEWFQAGELTSFGSFGAQLRYWRDELAAALGIESLWGQKTAGAQRMAAY